MKIALYALGSRGDIEPYIALGVGLARAGHDVRIVTHQNYGTMIKAHGLGFFSVRGDVQEAANSPEMKALLEKGNFIQITRHTSAMAAQAALQWAEDGLAGCQGVDLIVAGIGGLFSALALAEKLNVPLLQAYLIPFHPTAEFPGVLLPDAVGRLGGSFNRLSHHFTRQMIWQGAVSADRAARQQVLDLPTLPRMGVYKHPRLHGLPILYGISPAIIPKPADWGANIHMTGYWFVDPASAWTPPPSLIEFLDEKPKPLYVGFGSMSNRQPEQTADLVVRALEKSGQRAVLLSGWGGLHKTDLPDSVYMLESIPHGWLFPRVAAVVHHGGAGTSAAGFRAGVPTLITPFFADQPFWGNRAAALGVGLPPIPRKTLTVENLAHAFDRLANDQTMRTRAAALGERIRAEDGVTAAVRIIDSLEL